MFTLFDFQSLEVDSFFGTVSRLLTPQSSVEVAVAVAVAVAVVSAVVSSCPSENHKTKMTNKIRRLVRKKNRIRKILPKNLDWTNRTFMTFDIENKNQINFPKIVTNLLMFQWKIIKNLKEKINISNKCQQFSELKFHLQLHWHANQSIMALKQ